MLESIEDEEEDLLPAHPMKAAATTANVTGITKLLNLEIIRISMIFQ
jgi:hypothetical protein